MIQTTDKDQKTLKKKIVIYTCKKQTLIIECDLINRTTTRTFLPQK